MMYQTLRYESSANGITSPATWIAAFFGLLMLVALVVANQMTRFESEENDSDSKNLPSTYFIIITCWMFLSGSWLLWNFEAREFMLRKLCRIPFVVNIRQKLIQNESQSRVLPFGNLENNVHSTPRRPRNRQPLHGGDIPWTQNLPGAYPDGHFDDRDAAICHGQCHPVRWKTAQFEFESIVQNGSCSGSDDWGIPSPQLDLSDIPCPNTLNPQGWDIPES